MSSKLPVHTACLYCLFTLDSGRSLLGYGSKAEREAESEAKSTVPGASLKQKVPSPLLPSPLLRGGYEGDYGECLGCVGERVKRVVLVGAG